MKARLSNIQVRTIDENAYPEVEFMQRNPGAVSFGLNLINKR